MHPNRKFHLADREAMAGLVRELGFGILFAETEKLNRDLVHHYRRLVPTEGH